MTIPPDLDLSGVRARGMSLRDAEIDADIRGLILNGVAVEPLVRAELDRRHPERVQMRSERASDLWDAATRIHELWDHTIDRLRGSGLSLAPLRELITRHDELLRRDVLRMPDVVRELPPDVGLEALQPIWTDQYIELLGYLDDVSDDELELDPIHQLLAEQWEQRRFCEADLDRLG